MHAVAATNAIVGGLIVIEALKVLRRQAGGDADGVATPVPSSRAYRYTFVKQHKSNSRLLEPMEPDRPTSCVVCGPPGSAGVRRGVDDPGPSHRRVLKKKLGMNAPEVNAPETVLYEQDDGLDDEEIEITPKTANPAGKLAAGGVIHNTVLNVSDFTQKFEFDLIVTQAGG